MAKQDKENFIDYINSELRDTNKSIELADRFDKLKQCEKINGNNGDYYYWINKKSVNELKGFIEEIENQKSKSVQRKEDKQNGAIQIECPNKDWVIYKILDYGASNYYGKNTKWCITGNNGENTFNSYKEERVKDFYFLWKIGNEENGKWCYLDYGEPLRLSYGYFYDGLPNGEYFYDAQDDSHTIEDVNIPNDVLLSLPGISQKLLDDTQEKANRELNIIKEVEKTGVYVYGSITNYNLLEKTAIKKLIIPCNITRIDSKDKRVFKYCKSLQEIVILDGIGTIYDFEFIDYKYLKKITLPNSVKLIDCFAFEYCESLQEIIFSNTLEKIDECAFAYCTSLKKVTIPNSVKSIGKTTFKYCESLQEIIIPNSVEHIDTLAFYGCKSLKKITLPNKMKRIEDRVFENCESLQEVIIPNTIDSIGDGAFRGCKSLKKITIPRSVKEIGNYAFYNCISLQKVTILNGTEDINCEAFWGCTSLQKITLPRSTQKIDKSAFNKCVSLKQITIKGEYKPKLLEQFRTAPDDTNEIITNKVIVDWVDCGKKDVVYIQIKGVCYLGQYNL